MAKELKFKSIGEGLKGINFEAFGGFQGFLDLTSIGGTSGSRYSLLRRIVPWLAKANNMTANAIADLPFDIITDSGAEVDTSADWKDKLGGMPAPKRLIHNLASSLCSGAAYVIPTTAGCTIAALQYCDPQSVTPTITDQGVQYFDRVTKEGKNIRFYPANYAEQGETMMYFWLPDSDVELGPALTTPMSTALMSTELLAAMDSTLKLNAQSGFIPPTILAAKGMPAQGEREKTETWWNRWLRRWDRNVAKIINAEAMDIKRVGAGMDELKGVYIELTKQMIENIGASHGIPSALFMSDAAYASEMDTLTKVWYQTSEFINIYHTIEETFNAQLLGQWGLKLVFRPETLEIFQEDESKRATSYKTYIDAQMRPSIAAEMLGLDLPDGVDYKDLDDKYDKPEPVPVIVQGNQGQNKPVEKPEKPVPPRKAIALDAQQIKDLDLWRQTAVRKSRKGQPIPLDWECKALPDSIAAPIRERLAKAQNELDVVKAFDLDAEQPQDEGLHILEAIRLEVEAIKNTQ